jgi:hypothetical protein
MVVLPGLAPRPARAQIGYGWWFGGYQTPSSVTYLNERAAARTQAVLSSQPQALRVPARSGRDITFFERYDPATRRAMEEGIARRPSRSGAASTPAPSPPPASSPAPKRKVVALASFFDAQDQLVWPQDAPVDGDLKDKRAASDAASLAVLRETRSRRVAKIATVTEAREKLVDYGQPALERVRATATAGIGETFHGFLLGLYDALGAAALEPYTPSR